MRAEQKAKDYIARFGEMRAKMCVEEIIKALDITTGHMSLKRNDRLEYQSDIDYWNDVIKNIEQNEFNK